jgi:hypothetical protein
MAGLRTSVLMYKHRQFSLPIKKQWHKKLTNTVTVAGAVLDLNQFPV